MGETSTISANSLSDLFNNPEIQQATIKVLSKMPTLAKWVDVMESGTDLLGSLTGDQELIGNLLHETQNLKEHEAVQSAKKLTAKLPFLLKAIELAELGTDLIGPMITDHELIENVQQNVKGLTQRADPEVLRSSLVLLEKLPMLVQVVNLTETLLGSVIQPLMANPEKLEEIRAAMQKDSAPISAFSLLKLIKHPGVQRLLRGAVATMDAASN